MPTGRGPGPGGDGELAERHRARVRHRARPYLRPLLRQIVARGPEDAVLVRRCELGRVLRRAGVHTIGVAVDRDGGDSDRPLRGEYRLDLGVSRVASDEPVAMP